MPVTYFELAALSLDVYREPGRPALPPGWSLLFNAGEVEQPILPLVHDYFGSAYIKNDGEINRIVFAHRGTTAGFTWSALDDFEYWIDNIVPQQFVSANRFFVYGWAHLIKYSPYTLQQTGHSLGALLAELLVANGVPRSTAVTFESPGSMTLIQSMIDTNRLGHGAMSNANTRVLSIMADINAINSCKPHVGSYGSLDVGYEYLSNRVYGTPISPNEIYFFIDFTVYDQHKMSKLYNYLKNNTFTNAIFNRTNGFVWPVGFVESYKYYLNYKPYGNTAHQAYWDRYVQVCWDKNPQIHSYYNNNARLFFVDFINHVLRHDYVRSGSHSAPPLPSSATRTEPLIIFKLISQLTQYTYGLLNWGLHLVTSLLQTSPDASETRAHTTSTSAVELAINKRHTPMLDLELTPTMVASSHYEYQQIGAIDYAGETQSKAPLLPSQPLFNNLDGQLALGFLIGKWIYNICQWWSPPVFDVTWLAELKTQFVIVTDEYHALKQQIQYKIQHNRNLAFNLRKLFQHELKELKLRLQDCETMLTNAIEKPENDSLDDLSCYLNDFRDALANLQQTSLKAAHDKSTQRSTTFWHASTEIKPERLSNTPIVSSGGSKSCSATPLPSLGRLAK